MNEAKVIIADADKNYRLMMGELIDETPGLTMLGGAGSTAEALEMLRTGEADLLLMDILLPGGDGLCLLSQLSAMDIRPSVVVNTSFLSPMMASACAKHSVAAILQKPISADAVVERLLCVHQYREEQQPKAPGEKDNMYIRRRGTELLQSMGFSAHYKGYTYLREALVFALEHDQVTRGTLKIIFADVSRSCGASVGGIERAIRTMKQNHIAMAGATGTVPPAGGFSNMELIAVLHQKLSSEMRTRRKICR